MNIVHRWPGACLRLQRGLVFGSESLIGVTTRNRRTYNAPVTCQSTRGDYIQSVADLCDMTRHLSEMQREYAEAIRGGSALRATEVHRRWRLYTSGIQRLLHEEEAGFDSYQSAQKHHSA